MKRILTAATALLIVAGSAGGAAAQGRHGHDRHDRYDHGRSYARHDNGRHLGHYKQRWRTGGRIDRHDWNRGYRVDYRRYHLRQPPRGYEWRRVDNSYVLAAVATGLIASIIIANGY